MYTSIEIDFDVFKELTHLRTNPETSENDVLRSLLQLPPKKNSKPLTGFGAQPLDGVALVCKGVTFPHGTEFHAVYAGKEYLAKVEDGALVYDNNSYKSPSAAAMAITGYPTNGWVFWQCKMPTGKSWRPIAKLKKK